MTTLWTIAPDPFVPLVSRPVHSEIDQSTPVDVSPQVIVTAPELGEEPIARNTNSLRRLAPLLSKSVLFTKTQVSPFPDSVGVVGSVDAPLRTVTAAKISLFELGDIEAVVKVVPSVKSEPVVSLVG